MIQGGLVAVLGYAALAQAEDLADDVAGLGLDLAGLGQEARGADKVFALVGAGALFRQSLASPQVSGGGAAAGACANEGDIPPPSESAEISSDGEKRARRGERRRAEEVIIVPVVGRSLPGVDRA